MLATFILSNIAITLGYGFAAVFVAPLFHSTKAVKFFGFWFFLLCAWTHVEMVVHAGRYQDFPEAQEIFTAWHMVWTHLLQAIAIWGFVLTLYQFLKKADERAKALRRRATDIEVKNDGQTPSAEV